MKYTRKEKACKKIIERFPAFISYGLGDERHLAVISKIDYDTKALIIEERLQSLEKPYFLETSETVSREYTFEEFYNLVKGYEIRPIWVSQTFVELDLEQRSKKLCYFKMNGRFYRFLKARKTKDVGLKGCYISFATSFSALDLISGKEKTIVYGVYEKVDKSKGEIVVADDFQWYKDKNDMIIEMLGKTLKKLEVRND